MTRSYGQVLEGAVCALLALRNGSLDLVFSELRSADHRAGAALVASLLDPEQPKTTAEIAAASP